MDFTLQMAFLKWSLLLHLQTTARMLHMARSPCCDREGYSSEPAQPWNFWLRPSRALRSGFHLKYSTMSVRRTCHSSVRVS
ncbi:hypothetical protein KP509_01G089000 [Ceratopteris richardii]|uniref:Secreted protein n=1 Tax=Ceratopteris richardii TaxID=49495 RepID=A0A8T2VRK2_CERRI|nr:hypothetical protein KP509_01G089000 [Ceratopteris richardii]